MGAKANIVVDQGTDFATTITVRDNSGVAVNLTNYTGHGQIRKHYTSTTAHNMQIVFEMKCASFTTLVNTSNNDRKYFDCSCDELTYA